MFGKKILGHVNISQEEDDIGHLISYECKKMMESYNLYHGFLELRSQDAKISYSMYQGTKSLPIVDRKVLLEEVMAIPFNGKKEYKVFLKITGV